MDCCGWLHVGSVANRSDDRTGNFVHFLFLNTVNISWCPQCENKVITASKLKRDNFKKSEYKYQINYCLKIIQLVLY